MKSKIILILSIAAVFMSACMVGPKFQTPEVETPASFYYDSVKTDSAINLEWWTIFNDDVLDTLIKTALMNNKNVLIAASRVEEAAFVVGYNRADIYPNFTYSGGAFRGNVAPNGGVPTGSISSAYNGFGNVYWELDFWGKYRRATQAAKAELLASEYGLRSVQISLISTVATLYFELLDFNTRLIISEETLLSREKSLEIIGERFDKGIIPEIDLNQAQIQEAIAAANVPFYERLVANTEHALSIVLGVNPRQFMRGRVGDQELPSEIPVGIPSELLTRRPDITQAEQAYKAQNSRIGVAQAMRFPAIALTGVFGTASSDLSNLLTADAMAWSVAGSITGPIFNFGKNKRRVEIERERAEQLKLTYENTVLQAFREVEDALVEVETTGRELDALKRQLNAAENAATLSRARYDGGVTSYLEVLDTERSLFDSQLKTVDAYQRLLSSYVQLYKSLGGGWISEEEKQAAEEAESAE